MTLSLFRSLLTGARFSAIPKITLTPTYLSNIAILESLLETTESFSLWKPMLASGHTEAR